MQLATHAYKKVPADSRKKYVVDRSHVLICYKYYVIKRLLRKQIYRTKLTYVYALSSDLYIVHFQERAVAPEVDH